MNVADLELKERIKELNCLYALSRAAREAGTDLTAIISKTLDILPAAMQFPPVAEACITLNAKTAATREFKKSKYFIQAPLVIDKKKYGNVEVGYRTSKKYRNPQFLMEEKNLIMAVARELSFYIRHAQIEEEKAKLQTQLQHAERLGFVGELSAGIAHEMNEPLGRILGFAQLIKKAGNLNAQQDEDIERIIKASLYTREIIKKLMIFSRQMPQQLTKVNLNAVIENILYFIDVRFQSRGIKMVKQLSENLPDIQGDELQLSQVLVNLITNAVQAMPSGGRITVKTSKRPHGVRLIVKDTGVGMPTDVKAKIFEPFFTTKPAGQGTGLGLSVVQGIIDSHKGKIRVTSAPGKGSTFEVLLNTRHVR